MHATAGIPDQVFDTLALAVHARHPEAEAKIKLHLHRCKEEIEGLIKLRLLQGLRPTTIGEAMRLNFEISMREKAIDRLLELLTRLEKSMPNKRIKSPIEQWARSRDSKVVEGLMRKGKLDLRQYAAAHFICRVVNDGATSPGVRTSQLISAGRAPYITGGTIPFTVSDPYRDVYLPWTSRIRKYDLTLVLAIVVDDEPIYRVAARLKISRSRCISRLRKALDKLGA